jgi:hypothetical protein
MAAKMKRRKTCVKKFCKIFMRKKTAQNWKNIIANLEKKPHRTTEDNENLALYKSPGFVKNAVAMDSMLCPDWFCNPGCKGLNGINIGKSGFGDNLNRREIQKLGALSGCTNAPILDVKLDE